jgi:hypothetical protein
LGAIAGLALIAVILMLLLRRSGPSVAAAPPAAPSGPPVTAAPARPISGPPVVGAKSRPAAPEDPNRAALIAYLNRMAQVEAERKGIVNNVYPAMLTLALLKNMGGMQDMLQMLDEDVTEEQKKQTPPASVQKAEDTMRDYRNQFRGLALEVQRIVPPAPARRFQNGYIYCLGAYDAVLGDIQNSVQTGDQGIAARGPELSRKVSQALKATDDELQRLLDQYHITRAFTVSDDTSGNVMGGATGLTP